MPVSSINQSRQFAKIDSISQRLAAIESIATLLSFGYAEEGIVHPDPKLVASAWDGIALLAHDAACDLHFND